MGRKGKRFVDPDGKEWPNVADAAKAYGIAPSTLHRRIQKWGMGNALSPPRYSRGPDGVVVDHQGRQFSSVRSMCEYHGVRDDTYYKRIRSGYSKGQALTGVTAPRKVSSGGVKVGGADRILYMKW